ncbi:EF-P 5-aminopentanol modification-associated protein YfmF [Priestia megaterium]|uniref:EF-P 5-aminopentanol modification-associated protein YfmF n=1 Tax=Priestia megaterium TaxID=1404 RepID=UPI00366C62DA
MNQFQTFEKGPMAIHVLPTKKYVLTTIAVRVYLDLNEEIVTGAAMIPYILLQGSNSYLDNQSLQLALDRLYGAKLQASIEKKGEKQILGLSVTFPNPSNVYHEESVVSEIIAILSDVLFTPTFSVNSVENEKQHHFNRIINRLNNKITYSLERCLSKITEGQLYSISHLGYLQDIDRWTSKTLFELYNQIIQGSPLHIYVVGNIEPNCVVDELILRFEKEINKLNESNKKFKLEPPSPLRISEKNHTYEKFSLNQLLVNVGYGTGGIVFSSDDYPALVLCNRILGGFPHSKLFVNLRKEYGLAYFVSSSLDALKGIMYIQSSIKPDTLKKSNIVITEQIELIKKGVISEEEIELTIKGLCNIYKLSLDSVASLIDFHQNGIVSGRVRTMEEMLLAVQKVTLNEIISVAQKLEGCTLYLLGNKGESKDDNYTFR